MKWKSENKARPTNRPQNSAMSAFVAPPCPLHRKLIASSPNMRTTSTNSGILCRAADLDRVMPMGRTAPSAAQKPAASQVVGLYGSGAGASTAYQSTATNSGSPTVNA